MARLCLVAVSVLAAAERLDGKAAAPDPLTASGYSVTTGAAPGYVEDRLCGSCHADLYRSYQSVGMAKAFHRPRSDKVIEDFENSRFLHEKSSRYYEMSHSGDRYFFRRYQLDAQGRPVNVYEQPVDWILGSGSHVRTYLYQTPAGYIFQLPIAWYTQTGRWAMAPGYDRPSHDGVLRPITRECMFCHNAYPEVPEGDDAYGAPHVFPAELPEGLGCQRCHGPGAEHARIGMQVPVDFKRLAEAIVNPGDLEPQRRNDICYGCHMQPAVVVDGVRRFGRGDFSFRPGEALSSYMALVDVEETGREPGERFEINHHPYRLEQSRCFTESNGALSCQTCHDPHRKVPVAERPSHYRAACLGCHAEEACRLDAMTVDPNRSARSPIDAENCVACHMQERRPQDVVQVTMTDHFIRRQPGGDELLQPLQEVDHALLGVTLLAATPGSSGRLGEVYRAVAAIRVGSNDVVVDWLQETLDRARLTELAPLLDLARGQIEMQRPEAAARTLASLLERFPDHPRALNWQALLLADRGRREEALATLRRALDRDPDWPESRSTLGRLLSDFGRPREALPHFQHALELRPNMVETHLYQGAALAALGRLDEASVSYRRALAIEPSATGAYLALAQTLLARGERRQARSILRHGAEMAERPEPVREALARFDSRPP